jgi:glycosyltransferase involved in cell wall biosynthesis
MHQIKVAYVTTAAISLRYLVLSQLRNLLQSGYEVVGISSPGAEVPMLESAGIRYVAVHMTRRITPLADLMSLVRLYRLLRIERPDIVHTHTPKANLVGQWAAWLARVPIRISTVHGMYFTRNTPRPKRWFFQTVERWAARFAHVVFLVNDDDLRTATELNIIDRQRIRFLPAGTGIDLRRFDPAQHTVKARRDGRRALGLPDDAMVVGFVGRLVKEKGLLELFAAIREIYQRLPNVWLLVVGPYDVSKPDALSPDAAGQFGIADRCVFTGLRPDTENLYPLMDMFVLPSHREGMPLSLMEAAAMSIPCIATDIRGCRSGVIHGLNGLLVPLGDVHALAEAIAEIATDPDKARHMKEAGRRLAEERFDEQLVFRIVKTEYARLLCERHLPVPQLSDR